MSPGRMPDPSRPFDVAIAGAGLAGGALALQLARRGVRVAVLDSATFPRDKVCGEFLSPESWRTLDRLGIADDIVRSGYHPIHRFRLSTPRGRIIEANIKGPDGLPGIGLSRSVLDNLLVQRARQAGAEVFEGTRVARPIIRGGRVVGLRARHALSGTFDVKAAVTVAANGRQSALVRHTGMTLDRSLSRPRLVGLKQHFTVCDLNATEPAGTVGLHLIPGGYAGTCRIEGPLTNLCALLPESILRDHRGNLERLAGEYFVRNPILGRLWRSRDQVGKWKTVTGVRVQICTPRLPGIFYAGDSQGTIDPLGGQGMTMALLGAELLRHFIETALTSEAGSLPQLAYQAAWHRRFDRRVRFCRLFHHALMNSSCIDMLSLLRSVAPRVLSACFSRTRDIAPV